MSRITYSITDLSLVINQYILPNISNEAILLLYGQLGAGKTTLVKALVKQLGITADVSSPTFTYVNTYSSSTTPLTIHHFDLYRLHSAEEFIAQGFDEFLMQKNTLVIVEWPEVIEALLLNKKQPVTKIITLHLSHDFQAPEIRYMDIK